MENSMRPADLEGNGLKYRIRGVVADAALLEVVTPKAAARALGVAEKTLANWRAAALGPPYLKYGNRNGPVRYVLTELITWRDAHRHGEG
jgi:hypothetical protein